MLQNQQNGAKRNVCMFLLHKSELRRRDMIKGRTESSPLNQPIRQRKDNVKVSSLMPDAAQ